MVDPEIIKYIAVKTGLGINYICKDAKISELLEQLNQLFEKTKTYQLILKGGTAINRGYLEAPKRFSEDLDLDYISKSPLSTKIDHVKTILKNLRGVQLERSGLIHRTLRFDCRYVNEFQQKDTIRIEFYFSHRSLVAAKPPKEKLLKSNLESTKPCLFLIYSLEDIIARKLLALYNRTAGKDIYDTFYLLDLKFDLNYLKTAIVLLLRAFHLNLDLSKFVDAMLEALEKAFKQAKYIGNSTNHYLLRTYRPNWKQFIATLIRKIETLKPLLS